MKRAWLGAAILLVGLPLAGCGDDDETGLPPGSTGVGAGSNTSGAGASGGGGSGGTGGAGASGGVGGDGGMVVATIDATFSNAGTSNLVLSTYESEVTSALDQGFVSHTSIYTEETCGATILIAYMDPPSSATYTATPFIEGFSATDVAIFMTQSCDEDPMAQWVADGGTVEVAVADGLVQLEGTAIEMVPADSADPATVGTFTMDFVGSDFPLAPSASEDEE